MKLDKPGILALVIASLVGLIIFLGEYLIAGFLNTAVNWTEVIWMSVLAFTSAYLLIYITVNQFIYNKIKLIYKNIHELKTGSVNSRGNEKMHTDLDQVNTEVSEWAAQRQNEIQELKDREKFRREFIGNISHELKTPVFNIQGYLLTLLDGALADPEINHRYLRRANKSLDRMINMIEDMEMISNLESNRMHIENTAFDIVLLVKDVYELLEDKAAENNVSLGFKEDYEQSIKVVADRQKIEQVLINLVSNAIKYGNRKKGTVTVSFHDMHQNLLIEVTDNGVGIPQKDIPRIFERFYRVDKSRSREAGGTGLGLSIVKHILEAHKQSINVRSSEKTGTTFSFTLKKFK